ncbi:cytochrome c family protein [Rhizobium sp. ARZ01]|uniref:c-type cytochrome n=1 Tax=Rhizobium sp. ARZ01 TaxID=2769313 RepID=UPI001785B4E0|nr:cytochrome c family protein [Rhizobium sp. ARZ01]
MKITLASALLILATATAAQADGDATAGKTVFKKCVACHTTDPGNRVGPSLGGVVGRPVASADGFKYSKAMQEFGKDKVWDETALSEFLAAPRATVKGTSMAFAGLKKPQDIADLLAFLKDPAAVK